MILRAMFFLAIGCIVSLAQADVNPAGLFMDNMVIQRETQAPVWGWADPGEKINITASWGKSASVVADAKGHWKTKLQTPQAGGPHEIVFEGKNKVVCKNVACGDVWLCAGQSNMDMAVSRCMNADEEANRADHPNIRHFRVVRNPTNVPAKDCEGVWEVCNKETVMGFSGTAYFTGRKLHQQLDIPIGLITSSWCGTSVEAWTSVEAQKDDPVVQDQIKIFNFAAEKYDKKLADEHYKKAIKQWRINKKKAEAANEYVTDPPKPFTEPKTDKNYPSNLYHGMIHPLIPFAIKGATWYQGERNAIRLDSSLYYRVQLARMIRTWREVWGYEFPFYFVQLPNFMAPQEKPVEVKDTWPVIRESYVHVLKNVPNTGMAVTIDIGHETNIHPENKQGVGFRMALSILSNTYGIKSYSSPLYKSHKIENSRIVIDFDFVGSGLMAKGGELKTFAIAGADKKFVRAKAEINGNSVVVSSDKVKEPLAVRYAWANNPVGCNLFSKEGLPAGPFRTDDWDVLKP